MKVLLPVLLVAILTFTPETHAETKKEGAPGGSGRAFDIKESRHTTATPEQRRLFDDAVGSLVQRSTAVKASMQAGLGVMARTSVSASQISGLADLHWDETLGVPIFFRCNTLQGQSAAASVPQSRIAIEQIAGQFLQQKSTLLRLQDPLSELRRVSTFQDELGYTHVRYDQIYRGVEVWARDLYVHIDQSGNVESFSGRYIPTPTTIDVTLNGIGEPSARAAALRSFGSAGTVAETKKIILPDDAGGSTLCWLVGMSGSLDQRKDYFVDASSGRILKVYNRVRCDGSVTGSGTDVKGTNRSLSVYQIGSQYYMIDASKAMFNASQSQFPSDAKGVLYAFNANYGESNISYITSTNRNSWSVAPAVSALYTSARIYDYYKTVHGRNAIDNQGGTMNVVVNFKTKYNNAFWNGQYMVFGNGDGTLFSDLTGGADVTAHEMTHGITEWTANLVYENQSGALNESFSDVFGVLFEFWLEGAAGDWLLGEDVTTPGTAGDALRSMSDPGGSAVLSESRQPAHMSQYRTLPNTEAGDNGGVHVNSGIPNKAFYNFATASGMTKEDAGKVYYRALTMYLNKNAQFIDCRLAIIKSAEDLFGGAGNAKALAAAAAFDAVGITSTSGTATGDPVADKPVQGTEYVSVIRVTDGKLYRWTPGTTTALKLSSSVLHGRPAAADSGKYLFYVDQSTYLRMAKTDGTSDQAVSTTGGFNNIAVSRSGRYLAATSVYEEAVIYVFDLWNMGGDKQLHLYTPIYQQGETAGNIRYPDRIDWASDERSIMYDALNVAVLTGGDTLRYWDINRVRLADGSVARLFPSQPRGVDIGNAVFASNTDNIIALDMIDAAGQVKVLAVNLNRGDVGVVTQNGTSPGSPSFSVNDKKVYYHYENSSSSSYQIWSVNLMSDGITGAGDDVMEVSPCLYPLSFAIGSRPTDVSTVETLPSTISLEQNYPNPFNPKSDIRYHLPALSNSERQAGTSDVGYVKLAVYDLLGREVATLVDGRQSPGVYTVAFDGSGLASGVYLYRLTAGETVITKRMLLLK
jgi:bacillolysin